MLMRRVSAKDRIPDGLVRAALVSGIAVGVATASLGGIGTASGTCIGLSGININLGGGGGCDSSFGNFALGLGPGTVAVAREGFINGAIAIGTNVGAFAGIQRASVWPTSPSTSAAPKFLSALIPTPARS